MTDKDVSLLADLTEEIKGHLTALAEVPEWLETMRRGGLIPAAQAMGLSEKLARYAKAKEQFDAAFAEREIAVGGDISAVEELLTELRQKAEWAHRSRAVVLSYFRLYSENDNVHAALEESKRALMELCALPQSTLAQKLIPYEAIVQHLHKPKDLANETYDLIYGMSRVLARALDHDNLSTDPSADISAYLDGSCALLQKEGADAQTSRAPLFSGFTGYVEEDSVTLGADDASAFTIKKFTSRFHNKDVHYEALTCAAQYKVVREEWTFLYPKQFPAAIAFESLVQHGYLSRAQWKENGASVCAYVLTQKGREAYRRPDIKQDMKKKHMYVPFEMTAHIGALNALSLLRFDMIAHYRLLLPQSIDASCMSSLARGDGACMVFGALALSGGEETFVVVPALFQKGEEARDIAAIKEALAGQTRRALILVKSKSDIAALAQELEDRDGPPIHCYASLSEPLHLFDGRGALLRQIQDPERIGA